MRVRQLDIKGYRNLRDVHITFDDLTVIVGRNDIGKSNIVRAIELLLSLLRFENAGQILSRGGGGGNVTEYRFDGPLDYRLFTGNTPGTATMAISFEFSKPELIEVFGEPPWIAEGNQITPETIGDVRFDWIIQVVESSESDRVLQSIRSRILRISADCGLILYDSGGKNGNVALSRDQAGNLTMGQNFDLVTRLNEVVSSRRGRPLRFTIIEAERALRPVREPEPSDQTRGFFEAGTVSEPSELVEAVSVYETQMVHRRSGVIKQLELDMKHLFPYHAGFRTLLEEPGGTKDIFFGEFPSTQVGSGVKQVLQCLFRIRRSKADVIVVEEPEVHLHPAKQREFFQYLRDITKDNQLIVTTHSPSIVAETPFSGVRMVTGTPEEPLVLPLSAENLDQLVADLGIVPGDLFEFDSVLVAEGVTDQTYFEKADQLLKRKQTSSLAIVEAGGWGNVACYANAALLRKLRRDYLVVFDGDTEIVPARKAAKTAFLARSKLDPRRIATLRRPSIEHYYAVPTAISRTFPAIVAKDVRAALGNRTGRNLKEPLQRLFSNLLGRGFKTQDAINIIHNLHEGDIPMEIRKILQLAHGGVGRLGRPGKGAVSTRADE